MPYSRFTNLDEEKRNLIMEISLNEFLEKNFTTASINQISKKAGLSAGALYYYFENKEDLFYTTIEYSVGEFWNEFGDFKEIFNTIGYWEGIEKLVTKRLELTISHPKYARLLNRILNSDDTIEKRGKDKFLEVFLDIFEYGINNGYIRTDLPKELIFIIHFNMILSVNKWSLDQQLFKKNEEIDLFEISLKTVEMIKAAVGKDRK